jgi:hypothetical protein
MGWDGKAEKEPQRPAQGFVTEIQLLTSLELIEMAP